MAESSVDQTADALRQDSEKASADEQGISVMLSDGTSVSLKAVQASIITVFGENLQQVEDFSREIEALLK